MRIVIAGSVVLLMFGFSPSGSALSHTTALAAGPKDKKPAEHSLDDELLQGLGGSSEEEHVGQAPQRGAEPAKGKPGAAKAKVGSSSSSGDLDDELLKGLKDGEDIQLGGQPKGVEAPREEESPFGDLQQRMREVENRIADAKSDETTQRLQNKIVNDLTEIIKQLKQRKKSSSSSSSSSQQNQQTAEREKVEQPETSGESGEASGDESASNAPAKDSSSVMNQRKAEAPEGAALEEALKDIWGQLPAHLRQQMEQYAKEELLPKYELQIEEYFRALARGQRDRP